jgi:SAM-dependent methyltransferase
MSREETVTKIREQRAEEAIRYLKLSGHNPKSGLLLDLGCGPGYLTRYFLKLDIDAVGVDISGELIKSAKKRVPYGNFIWADGVKLPFREESFSTTICNDALEHVPYNLAKPMLKEAKRTLKTGGKLYISVMNRYTLSTHSEIPFLTWLPRPCWDAISKLIAKRPFEDHPYTVRSLRKLCREIGFTCENYTWLYAWKKVSNAEHVRHPTLNKAVKVMRKLGLSKLAYVIAEKVSVILFICEK